MRDWPIPPPILSEQMSYETDSSVVGVFIDKLTAVLEKSSQGPAPKPDEAIPVEKLNELVTDAMQRRVEEIQPDADAAHHRQGDGRRGGI